MLNYIKFFDYFLVNFVNQIGFFMHDFSNWHPHATDPIAQIDGIDHEGRGVAHNFEKVLFVEGALPHEAVTFSTYRKKSNFDQAQIKRILKVSPSRVQAGCPYFNLCGGCNLQHLEISAQVAIKQRILEDNLAHLAKVKAERILTPIYGPTWGYRTRARLSARFVEKKQKMLVGFHEKKSSFVADMTSCAVLVPHVSALIVPLQHLLQTLSIYTRIPQVEVAVGDACTVLVLRILEPLSVEDESKLKAFADTYQIQWALQPKGPDSVYYFYPEKKPALYYRLPEFDITMPFGPTEFTQVNHAVNRMMVKRAMNLLDPQPEERIADFFCGLGNFTLPIARLGAQVVGFEGSEALVKRAYENAAFNQLAERTHFYAYNLFTMKLEELKQHGRFDKILIDPPRDGAVELIKLFGELPEELMPKRIVYVSCNPATLARDAGILVHLQGYQLKAAGIMNMFPHTAHVESIAVFERE